MFNLPSKLARLETPIRVGVAGAGLFGTKLVDQVERAPGMRASAIADLRLDAASSAFEEAGVDNTVKTADEIDSINQAIGAGDRAVTKDGVALARSNIDVLVEATGVPDAGARHVLAALVAGTDVVNATVETDSAVGPELASIAREHDAVYSLAYGDQPAVMVELCDWARTIGFEVVAAGRGSMYVPDYRHATPDDVFERIGFEDTFVEAHDLNDQMYNSFLDGTKIAVETCALANAAGLDPDVPGMHHRTLEPHEVPEILRPEEDGGILSQKGVIETVSGRYADGTTTAYDLGPSVFIVVEAKNPAVQEFLLAHDGAGIHVASDGRYAFFHRPYHLASIETPISIAMVALRGEPTGAPIDRRAEVVGAAKRDLEAGETLDGGGGYTVYGLLESAERAAARDRVPFELLQGATLRSPISQDQVITHDDVELQESLAHQLRYDPGSIEW